jgi:Fe2+ transport system protein FeoA
MSIRGDFMKTKKRRGRNRSCRYIENSTLPENCIFLNQVEENENVELKELLNNGMLKKKLQEMGLTKGVKFTVVNNINNGPVVISIRGTKLALGIGMSEKIIVRKFA